MILTENKNKGVQLLAQVIINTTVESLNISHCEIGDIGMAEITSDLRHI